MIPPTIVAGGLQAHMEPDSYATNYEHLTGRRPEGPPLRALPLDADDIAGQCVYQSGVPSIRGPVQDFLESLSGTTAVALAVVVSYATESELSLEERGASISSRAGWNPDLDVPRGLGTRTPIDTLAPRLSLAIFVDRVIADTAPEQNPRSDSLSDLCDSLLVSLENSHSVIPVRIWQIPVPQTSFAERLPFEWHRLFAARFSAESTPHEAPVLATFAKVG